MERAGTKAEEEEDDESDPNESDTSQKTEEYTLAFSASGCSRVAMHSVGCARLWVLTHETVGALAAS